MKYFKRKDGSVFGKEKPSKEQTEAYKKDGSKVCDSKELIDLIQKPVAIGIVPLEE